MFKSKSVLDYALLITGGFVLSFGMYNIHSISKISEGGVLGATLLFYQWFNISPSITGLIMNLLCYGLGYKLLGKRFIVYSIISSISSSLFYALFELFPPVYPNITNHPLLASIIGAIFVGVGVGLAIKAGGAPGGDDALALSINKLTNIKIQWIYLIDDLVILLLSLTYIPLDKIIYSLITVTISGQIIGFIEHMNFNVSRETS